jgi:hypothetical protein
MAHFRLKQSRVFGEINNHKTRIQFYIVEVQAIDTRLAEKLLMNHEEDPVEFVFFHMRIIKNEAYLNNIALVV